MHRMWLVYSWHRWLSSGRDLQCSIAYLAAKGEKESANYLVILLLFILWLVALKCGVFYLYYLYYLSNCKHNRRRRGRPRGEDKRGGGDKERCCNIVSKRRAVHVSYVCTMLFCMKIEGVASSSNKCNYSKTRRSRLFACSVLMMLRGEEPNYFSDPLMIIISNNNSNKYRRCYLINI